MPETSGKRACDQCKFRKIRCSLSQPCTRCVARGFTCTFIKPQQKRGPAGKRVSEIERRQGHASSNTSEIAEPPVLACDSPASSICKDLHEIGPGATLPLHGPGRALSPSLSQPFEGDEPDGRSQPRGRPFDAGTFAEPLLTDQRSWISSPDVEYWLPNTLDIPRSASMGESQPAINMNFGLPSIIQTEQSVAEFNTQAVIAPEPASENQFESYAQPLAQETVDIWPSSVADVSLIPWIDMYFERLYPTLPILNRSSLFARILSQEHKKNPQFGAMLLSLCAFALTQPVQIRERPTSSSRAFQAKSLMDEASKMRSSSDFGENPNLDAVLTSFFLFACLFGSNQHNAAWLRLREAIDLGSTLCLYDPGSFHGRSTEDQDQRLRTYLILAITERAYALQRRHSIGFRGRPGVNMRSIHEFTRNAGQSVSGIIIQDDKDAAAMTGLIQLMSLFDAIDEDIVDCWNGLCGVGKGQCQIFDSNKARTLFQNLNGATNLESEQDGSWLNLYDLPFSGSEEGMIYTSPRETQRADILITQKWLENCIWQLCLTHNLLEVQHEHPELSFRYAISIAESTLDICFSLSLSSMETHGIGLIEKIYNIATSAVSTGRWELSGPPEDIERKFLNLLTTLRGGNHPYLENYITTFNSQRLAMDG